MATEQTKISIANQAVVLIGAEPIQTFDDESVQASTVSSLYETTKRDLLVRHPWRFAIRQSLLSQDVTPPIVPTTANNWQFAYKLPADLLKIKQVAGRPNYEVYEQRIYANINEVLLDYWFDTPEADLPPDFVKAFTHKLASELAYPITEERTKMETFFETAEIEIAQAIVRDLQSRPEEIPSNSQLLQVRFGGGGSSIVTNDGRWR